MSDIQLKITRHTKKWNQQQKQMVDTDSQMIQGRVINCLGQEEKASIHMYTEEET